MPFPDADEKGTKPYPANHDPRGDPVSGTGGPGTETGDHESGTDGENP